MYRIVVMEEVINKMMEVGYTKEESYSIVKNIRKKKKQGVNFLNELKVKANTCDKSAELLDLINCWIGEGYHTILSYKKNYQEVL